MLLKLFQSIFGENQVQGRYPESLVEMAIERAVDGTDPRLRALPGYRKRLREPVLHAIDHVVRLVEGLPPALPAGQESYAGDPRLSAMFASAGHMLEVFSRDKSLGSLVQDARSGRGPVAALLLADLTEKNILGMELIGGSVQRDVAQVSVSFGGYRLLDPTLSEPETRRLLMRRAFDHLLTLALGRIVDRREERADLIKQRDLLKRKLAALQKSGWSFAEANGKEAKDEVAGELDDIEQQIAALGSAADVLEVHLDLLSELLGSAERQLWAQPLELWLDSMNIRRESEAAGGRHVALQALHNAQGRRLVCLLVAIDPAELPQREHYLEVAQRFL